MRDESETLSHSEASSEKGFAPRPGFSRLGAFHEYRPSEKKGKTKISKSPAGDSVPVRVRPWVPLDYPHLS